MSFIPPPNFGMVEADLYRSGQPNQLNFPFLEKLHLRKVIYLAPDEPMADFLKWLDDRQIELVHLGEDVGKRSPWKPVSEEMVVDGLHQLLEPNNYPLIVMCNLGRHRTGTMIGCMRKLQGWSLTSILEECVSSTPGRPEPRPDPKRRHRRQHAHTQASCLGPRCVVQVPQACGRQVPAAQRTVHRVIRRRPGESHAPPQTGAVGRMAAYNGRLMGSVSRRGQVSPRAWQVNIPLTAPPWLRWCQPAALDRTKHSA